MTKPPPPVAEKTVPARPWVALFLLMAVAGAIYSNTFSVPFILDDTDNIVENANIQDLSNLLDLSDTRYVGYLSFALNYHFGGLDVFGYHLVNLCIHIMNGFLVYWLVLLLCRAVQDSRPASVHWTALATALLFISHPIQTQAVTYIVQRLASLVTLFYLLSVACYLKWRMQPPPPLRGGGWGAGDHPLPYPPPSRGRGRLWYIAALCSTSLAMKTKENSFTIPLMILLVEATFFRPFTKKRWATLIPFILTLLVIPVAGGYVLGESEYFARDATPMSRSTYLFTQFRVIVTYLRLLVFPINQNLDYDYPVYDSMLYPEVFLSFLALLSLFGYALYSILRPGSETPAPGAPEVLIRPRLKLMGFGILWFFLALSIESSIIPIKDVIFEHRLYLPSAGFFLAVSLLVGHISGRWQKTRRPLVAFVYLIVCLLSFVTYRRNLVWADAVTLCQDAVNKAPWNARAHSNLGTALTGKGLIEESIPEFRTAIALKPAYHQAHNNLGSSLLAQGHIDEAIKEFQAALTIKPDYPEVRYNLGVAFVKQGRIEEAIREYRAALDLKPGYVKARNNLGTIYAQQGRLQEAAREFEEVLRLKGTNADTHNNLANVYLLQGRVEEAIGHYEEALRLRPDFKETRNNLERAKRPRGETVTP